MEPPVGGQAVDVHDEVGALARTPAAINPPNNGAILSKSRRFAVGEYCKSHFSSRFQSPSAAQKRMRVRA
jgi:hypothetical protein